MSSSTDPEERSNPEHHLTPAERDNLNRLEAVAQRDLGAYLQVGNALGEIRDRHLYRDTHASFETYLRERWAVDTSAERESRAALPHTPCEALARACEETLSALADDRRMDIEIRVAVRNPEDPAVAAGEPAFVPTEFARPTAERLLPTLRWLLTEASGTLALVAHQLESRATDIDDEAREQLRDDVFLLEDEIATVKALLLELVDWDSELGRLLRDELAPFEPDPDSYFDDADGDE